MTTEIISLQKHQEKDELTITVNLDQRDSEHKPTLTISSSKIVPQKEMYMVNVLIVEHGLTVPLGKLSCFIKTETRRTVTKYIR